MYSPYDNELLRIFTSFKETAYCGRFRNDGKLIVAGGEEGIIQVFDVGTRTALRKLKKHTKAVHSVDFSADGYNVVSGSDDCSLVVWDMAQEEPLTSFTGHRDYVRCCVAHPTSKSLFLSGSYDHTLKLWDAQSGECVATMDHGAPVECVLPFSNGTSVVSSGGNVIRVWDLMGSYHPMASFSNHQKTIMSLCFDGQQQRLLSGGLDKQVKVYNLTDYTVVHHFTYPAPITCIAISPNDSHLVVGMTERILSVKQKLKSTMEMEKGEDTSFLFQPSPSRKSSGKRSSGLQDDTAVVVSTPKTRKLKQHDILLKNFEYRKTLDDALHPRHHGNTVLTYSVIQELIRRDGLRIALLGRTEEELVPVVDFIIKNITNPLYTSLLVDMCDLVIGKYGLPVTRDVCIVRRTLCFVIGSLVSTK
jgi:U3 small nucleolar RNA-associated protein 15